MNLWTFYGSVSVHIRSLMYLDISIKAEPQMLQNILKLTMSKNRTLKITRNIPKYILQLKIEPQRIIPKTC